MLLNMNNVQLDDYYVNKKDLEPLTRKLRVIHPDNHLIRKVHLVIRSCTTREQVRVAKQYFRLALEKLERSHKESPDLYRELHLCVIFFEIDIQFKIKRLEAKNNENL